MTDDRERQMANKLYVSNVSPAATLATMRQLFSTCGGVEQVEFAGERGARNQPSAAYVTMVTSVGVDKALQELNGRLHGDRVLVISRLSDDHRAPQGRSKAVKEVANVVMTQQYRDRHALTYELSCSGKLLTLRFVFPLDDTQDWRVEALLTPASTPVTASAMTRERAFQALVGACGASGGELAEVGLDWEGVGQALRAVRAI